VYNHWHTNISGINKLNICITGGTPWLVLKRRKHQEQRENLKQVIADGFVIE
jgi:hypothetical protein